MKPDEEFVTSFVILGGICFAGLCLSLYLIGVGIAIFRKRKEQKITIHGKEKQNGQAKGGSHGSW